jgi:hypothetical protein
MRCASLRGSESGGDAAMLNPRAPVYRIELEVPGRGTLGPQPTGRPLFPPLVPPRRSRCRRPREPGTPRPRAPGPRVASEAALALAAARQPPCGRPLVLVNTRPLSRRASRPSLTGAGLGPAYAGPGPASVGFSGRLQLARFVLPVPVGFQVPARACSAVWGDPPLPVARSPPLEPQVPTFRPE